MKTQVVAIIVAIVIILIMGFFEVKGATECQAKGGVYIVSKSTFPACVQGVK